VPSSDKQSYMKDNPVPFAAKLCRKSAKEGRMSVMSMCPAGSTTSWTLRCWRRRNFTLVHSGTLVYTQWYGMHCSSYWYIAGEPGTTRRWVVWVMYAGTESLIRIYMPVTTTLIPYSWKNYLFMHLSQYTLLFYLRLKQIYSNIFK